MAHYAMENDDRIVEVIVGGQDTDSNTSLQPTGVERDDPATSPALPNARARRLGRRSRFTPDEDITILREVAAAKAHIAPQGQTKERFEIAAVKINQGGRVGEKVGWKTVQDRYKRLQCRFDEQDKKEALMSGVGGEVGEADELLAVMKEAREDIAMQKRSNVMAADFREKEKERLGSVIREMSTKRTPQKERTGVTEDDDSGEERKSKRARVVDVDLDGFMKSMKQFCDVLKESDSARAELEREKLNLAKKQMEMDTARRAEEREERERAAERARQQDLERLQLILKAVQGGRGGGAGAQ